MLVAVGCAQGSSTPTPSRTPSASLVGWAVGDRGTMLTTTDGGRRWRRASSGVSTDLVDIDFASAQDGCAVVDGGTILTTRDAGGTWLRQDAATDSYLTCVDFADPVHGWIGGERGLIATSDGGRTWARQETAWRSNAEQDAWCYGLHFVDGQHGWAVGGANDADYGVIAATSDGGATWQSQHLSGETSPYLDHALLLAVTATDSRHVWAVGWDILLSTDGGANWSDQPQHPKFFELNDVEFVDSLHGWTVGETGSGGSTGRGIVLVTTDGGLTWSRQGTPPTGGLSSIQFTSPTHGWITGGDRSFKGVILETKNRGETWTRQRLPRGTPYLRAITFPPDSP